MKSKSLITLIFLTFSLFIFTSAVNKDEWKSLLDKDLSQWDMYLSFAHQPGYNGEAPKDKNGKLLKPIGYNKNVSNVFSVVMENGEPVLRVSGEIYGCVFTKEEFEDYHLKLKVKWGTKKWVPRLHEAMDSGILYNSQGECGVDYWRSWMLSQEFQVMENGMGDYWSIANSAIDVRGKMSEDVENYIARKNANWVSMGSGASRQGFCQRRENFEMPMGEWNTLELISYGDKSLHIVNGHVVMALSNSRYNNNGTFKPLTKGKIQLQSEAAEVFYKDMMIKNIDGIPQEYAAYFE